MIKYLKVLFLTSFFILFFINANTANAAIASAGTLGATNSKTANQSSLVLTTTATAEANNIIIVTIAKDNVETTGVSTYTNDITSVVDSTGANTYTQAYSFTNAEAQQAGAMVSVWYTKVSTQLTSGGTITVNFNNNTLADATAISAWEYTVGSGNTLVVQTQTELQNDNADPGSVSLSSLANQEWLFFRGIAAETNTATLTNTTNYTVVTGSATTGGGEATNMAVTGEFRIVTATSGTSDPTLADTTNDNVSVFIAFKEQALVTISGVIRQTDESTAYDCSTGGPYTVALRVNNSGSYSANCTLNTGAWSISNVTVSSGQTVYVYIDGEAIAGSVVLVSDGTGKTDVDIFQSRVIIRDDVNGSITNSEISTGNTSDADDLVAISGSALTITSGNELHIYTGDTHAPGGNVTTDKLHVVGTYSGSSETITILGSGTGTSRPIYTNGGTFNPPTTTTFQGNGNTEIEAGTYQDINLTPTITGTTSYTFLGVITATNLTINPTASTTPRTLTVNLGGQLNISSSTITIAGTGTGLGVLDTRPASTDYTVSTRFIDIQAGGTLDASGSSSLIALQGLSGTLFTLSSSGSFLAGSSTVTMQPDASVTLFGGTGTFTLFNLNLEPFTSTSNKTYTIGKALTIDGDFTINPASTASLSLSVIMSGNITVASTKTTNITRNTTPTSATSVLYTRSGSTDYNLSTGFLTIGTGATLASTDSGSTSAASTITLTGSSTSTSVFTKNGTFTKGTSTVVFNADANINSSGSLFSADPSLHNLSLTPTITTSGKTYNIGSALTLSGNFTINPTASSSLALTVNAGGDITGAATTTLTLTGTTSGTSLLDLSPSSTDYNISTGFVNVASAGTLDLSTGIGNSIITLTGTSGTLFTRAGTFPNGGAGRIYVLASGTPTLNSGTLSLYNLTVQASSATVSTSTDAITITNGLDVTNGTTFSLISGQNLTHSGTTLTLAGTMSGSGTYIYSGSGTLPTTGTLSANVRFDATNNDHTVVNRTYGANVELYNNSGSSARTFTTSAGTVTVSGNLTINAANTQNATLTGATNNSTVNVTGNVDFTGVGAGTEALTTGTGTWTVSGNVDFTAGTFTATAGNTFNMNGTAKTVTSASQAFRNFAVTGGSVSNVDSMDVNGTFSVTSGSFTHGAGSNIDINISGNFALSSSTTWTENVTTGSDVIFDGDLTYADNNATKQSIGNVQIGTSPDTTRLTTDFAANSLTVTSADVFNTCEYDLDIGNGGITINGTFDTSATGTNISCSANEGNETTINDANSFTLASGATFIQDQSTLIMDDNSGTNDLITDGSFSLYNLTISAGASVVIEVEDALDVDNNLTITTGTLDVVTGENNAITVGGNWDTDDTFQARSGTVTMDATSGTKTMDADGTGTDAFYNLTLNDGGGTATFQLTTALDANNNFTITGGTFDANGQNINIGNNYSNSDIFTANSNTVTMDATDAGNTLSGTMTGSSSFYNLIFNDGGATGAWTFGTNSATVTNNLTVTGGTITAPSTTLTIGGNFNNQDIFTHNSGTVVFNDSGKTSLLTYAATTTFNNFTVSTPSKAMQFEASTGVVTDVNGAFTIQGGSCSTMVSLDSETNDDAWEIDVTGATVDIDYANVEDSTAITTAITADQSADGGGNTNWTINTNPCVVGVRGFGGVRGFSGVRIKP